MIDSRIYGMVKSENEQNEYLGIGGLVDETFISIFYKK